MSDEQEVKEQQGDVVEQLIPKDNPAELAATNYKLYTPRFLALCFNMGKKPLSRVLEALILFPLEEHRPLITQQEKEAFAIGRALMDAKFMMMLEALKSNLEDAEVEQKKEGEIENGKVE